MECQYTSNGEEQEGQVSCCSRHLSVALEQGRGSPAEWLTGLNGLVSASKLYISNVVDRPPESLIFCSLHNNELDTWMFSLSPYANRHSSQLTHSLPGWLTDLLELVTCVEATWSGLALYVFGMKFTNNCSGTRESRPVFNTPLERHESTSEPVSASFYETNGWHSYWNQESRWTVHEGKELIYYHLQLSSKILK